MSRLDTEPALLPHEWRAQARRALAERFTYLDWLTAVDRTDADPGGFDVVTRLLDVRTPGQWRARVLRTRVVDGAALDSLTPVYAGAAWHEREVHEMFGIGFAGFDDGTGRGLRGLLLGESAPQAPLRKSLFLSARAARPWPGANDLAGPAGRRRLQPPGVPQGDPR